MIPLLRRIAAVLVLLLGAGCTGRETDSDTDSDIDSDTEFTCDWGERASFIATQRVVMCEYWEGCPGDEIPFESRAECESYLQTIWSDFSWDECEAARCYQWLQSTPTCEDPKGPVDPSCDAMVQNGS